MRLFLSSYKVGNQPDKLLSLVGANKRAAIIINAHDYKPAEERAEKAIDELSELSSLGFEPFELDLRDYFDKPFNGSLLDNVGLVWVRGGNVFVLRLAMKLSGFDVFLKDALQKDLFVYGGYSAGGCVLSPSLQGYDIVDDATLTQTTYGLEPDYSALGIIDYAFEPHYKSDHPESADIDKEIEKLERLGLPYKTLHDGEVILVDGEKEELLP